MPASLPQIFGCCSTENREAWDRGNRYCCRNGCCYQKTREKKFKVILNQISGFCLLKAIALNLTSISSVLISKFLGMLPLHVGDLFIEVVGRGFDGDAAPGERVGIAELDRTEGEH